MFQILTPDQFVTSPWKNGGGVTHEIARIESHGQWLWRLSLAEVDSDGPFSRFDGMARILTVIDGAGMRLETLNGLLMANPLQPLAFAGETPVMGRLLDGPIRDLNLIYDPTQVQADVRLWLGEEVAAYDATLIGLYALSGDVRANGESVPPGAMVLGSGFTLQGGRGILVQLT